MNATLATPSGRAGWAWIDRLRGRTGTAPTTTMQSQEARHKKRAGGFPTRSDAGRNHELLWLFLLILVVLVVVVLFGIRVLSGHRPAFVVR